ncbi:MAG: EAL domain-containing protein [Anaeromyxobacter sp.]
MSRGTALTTTPRPRQRARRAPRVPAALREALDAGRLGVCYQPVIEVRSGAACAHEALARLHARSGAPLDTAGVFSALRLDPALLADAELAAKRVQLDHAPSGHLFVNVDPLAFAGCQARQLPLVDELAGRGRVVVELIETECHGDGERIRGMIQALSLAGLGVALDDLGAPGKLVSLESLLDVQYLKLDRSTLSALRDWRHRALVEALVGLARRLGVRTVLEGVETRGDLAVAEALGVDLVQGFLFRDRNLEVAPLVRRRSRRRARTH